jgi:hypothetical protein
MHKSLKEFLGAGKSSYLVVVSRPNEEHWPTPQKKSRDDLKAHFAHLFQEVLASTINLHLDRFRGDSQQFCNIGVRTAF